MSIYGLAGSENEFALSLSALTKDQMRRPYETSAEKKQIMTKNINGIPSKGEGHFGYDGFALTEIQ